MAVPCFMSLFEIKVDLPTPTLVANVICKPPFTSLYHKASVTYIKVFCSCDRYKWTSWPVYHKNVLPKCNTDMKVCYPSTFCFFCMLTRNFGTYGFKQMKPENFWSLQGGLFSFFNDTGFLDGMYKWKSTKKFKHIYLLDLKLQYKYWLSSESN